MEVRDETLLDGQQTEGELDRLRERLAEAWWNEEPLDTIQELERDIVAQSQALGRWQSGGA